MGRDSAYLLHDDVVCWKDLRLNLRQPEFLQEWHQDRAEFSECGFQLPHVEYAPTALGWAGYVRQIPFTGQSDSARRPRPPESLLTTPSY